MRTWSKSELNFKREAVALVIVNEEFHPDVAATLAALGMSGDQCTRKASGMTLAKQAASVRDQENVRVLGFRGVELIVNTGIEGAIMAGAGIDPEVLDHYWTGDASRHASVLKVNDRPLIRLPFVGEVVKVAGEHTLEHFISTPRIDYVRDIMNPFGANLAALQKNGGVFWNHAWDQPGTASLPIGRNVGLEARKDGILARTQYAVDVTKDDFAGDVYRLTKGGFIKSWSVGFFPSGAERVKLSDAMARIGDAFPVPNADAFSPESEVILHSSWDLFEYSAVGVPMNQDAVNVSGLKRALAAGEIKSALGLEHFGKLAGGREHLGVITLKDGTSNVRPMERWNRAQSKMFDVATEVLPISTKEYELASAFLRVDVKAIREAQEIIPAPEIGAFLTGLREEMAPHELLDTRNILEDGRESPPVFETVQLNSHLSEDFLVRGSMFYDLEPDSFDVNRMILRFRPTWNGLSMTVLTARSKAAGAQKMIEAAWTRAKGYGFLRGEAMSISGEFLDRGKASGLEGIFLTAPNQAVIERTIKTINEKGAGAANRGLVLLGPPGTGKTLTGRAVMNSAKATFLWVSARDFYYLGAFGGLSYAFQLAKQNAPAVIFLEDVDNWLTDTSIDYLKTEMDGIVQTRGITTFLTTNYPERFPKALIDRPGRFHDVLNFNLPDEETRTRMLSAWGYQLPPDDLKVALEQTAGLSGAHLYELCNYARTLESEESGIDAGKALILAIEKVVEQREMIDHIQEQGGIGMKSLRLALTSQVLDLTKKSIAVGPDKMDQALGLLRTLVGEVAELRHQVESFRSEGEKSLETVVEKSEQVLTLLSDAIDLKEKEYSNQPATAAGGAPEAKGHQVVKLSELIDRAITKSAPPTQARIHNQ